MFQGRDVFFRITALVFSAHRNEIAEPMELFFDVALFFFGVIVLAFLISPVRSNAAFSDLIHLFGPDLDFVDVAVTRDDCRMERLVKVWLRHGDVIFKTPWDRFVCSVDDTKDGIAVHDAVCDDTDSQNIVEFVEVIVLQIHLAVNRVD